MKAKVLLVFNDWQDDKFNSVYQTEEGVDLAAYNFHSGSTYEAEIELDASELPELEQARAKGFRPIFELVTIKK